MTEDEARHIAKRVIAEEVGGDIIVGEHCLSDAVAAALLEASKPNEELRSALAIMEEKLKAFAWLPIAEADTKREIIALSPAWIDGRRPIVLRWFKYNGLEAWRDWDSDPHFPTVFMYAPDAPVAR